MSRWQNPVMNPLSDAALLAWLRYLFSAQELPPPLAPAQQQAWLAWLAFHQLAPLAWTRLHNTPAYALPPQAASSLRRLVFSRVAVTATRRPALMNILAALQQQGIEVVLLKGALFTWTGAYPVAMREMNDFDLWVQAPQMPQAVHTLQTLGYRLHSKSLRPLALALAEQSEIEMLALRPSAQAVDLHFRPLQGKWLAALLPTGVIGELWGRRQPVTYEGITAYRLANEDNLLHLALHIAVNHQMGRPGLRALWDVATSLRVWPVAWEQVLQRVRAWRVGTALYLVLSLLADLFGVSIPPYVLDALRPSPWRRRLLQTLLPRATIVRGSGLSRSHRRYLYDTAPRSALALRTKHIRHLLQSPHF